VCRRAVLKAENRSLGKRLDPTHTLIGRQRADPKQGQVAEAGGSLVNNRFPPAGRAGAPWGIRGPEKPRTLAAANIWFGRPKLRRFSRVGPAPPVCWGRRSGCSQLWSLAANPAAGRKAFNFSDDWPARPSPAAGFALGIPYLPSAPQGPAGPHSLAVWPLVESRSPGLIGGALISEKQTWHRARCFQRAPAPRNLGAWNWLGRPAKPAILAWEGNGPNW